VPGEHLDHLDLPAAPGRDNTRIQSLGGSRAPWLRCSLKPSSASKGCTDSSATRTSLQYWSDRSTNFRHAQI
jgi:hypothetical protein